MPFFVTNQKSDVKIASEELEEMVRRGTSIGG